MPSEVFLLLSLVAGFWLLYRAHILRLIAEHLKQPIVVLLSAFFGAWLALGGRGVAGLLHKVPLWAPAESFVRQLAPWNFAGSGLVALLLAIGLAEFANVVWSKEDVNQHVIDAYGSEVLRVLHESMVGIRPVAVTLNSREVCVGFVQRLSIMPVEARSVRMLSVATGYQDSDDLAVGTPRHTLEQAATQPELVAIPLDAVKKVAVEVT
jgi:hypothetical protein